ncbi:hypothetical protein CQY20_31355, partial [Mycolicibacterium agri]
NRTGESGGRGQNRPSYRGQINLSQPDDVAKLFPVVTRDFALLRASTITAVMTGCAFDMADLPAYRGVNYVAKQLPTMS